MIFFLLILGFGLGFFQMLNSQITTAQHMEREKAYDIVSLSLCTLLSTLSSQFREHCSLFGL